MSNKRITGVWQHSKQKNTARLVLLSLADRADDDGFCWPGIDDIAARCKTDRRSVSRIIKRIRDDKELYIHERIGSTHQYLVLPGMSLDEITTALDKRFGVDFEDALDWLVGGGDNLSPLTIFTWGDDGIYMGGMTNFTPEPSITQKEPPKGKVLKATPKIDPNTFSTLQDYIWGVYGLEPMEIGTAREPVTLKVPRFMRINTPANLELWKEWVQFREVERQKKRFHIGPAAAKKQLITLAKQPDKFEEIINASINSGWAGLFPYKDIVRKNGKPERLARPPVEEY